MPINTRIPTSSDSEDSYKLGLSFSRFDERQRRLRLRLPHEATCWDYAPLIDVIRTEPGFPDHRFTGKSAAECMSLLRNRHPQKYEGFRRWYASIVDRHLVSLARRPRIPDNHYCIEWTIPPLEPSLPGLIRGLGLKRASVKQWSDTLNALTEKGLRLEELEKSGLLTRLGRLPPEANPTQAQVLKMIDLSHVKPKVVCEARFGYVTKSAWRECCRRIPANEFKQRRLLGQGRGAWYIIRFRHHDLNWSIVRSRYSDLFTQRSDWWGVLNDKGRLIHTPEEGLDSPEEAMEFAELQMNRASVSQGKSHAISSWETYSLPGGEDYREILLQLADWPGDYRPRHYRTRNVLVHVRASIRSTGDGRRVLFLDEVQSDWHADLHAKEKQDSPPGRISQTPDAPFRKEWPLLAMKVMLWWAQWLGLRGMAWSTAELQLARWQGYGPPEMLYRKVLPDAGRSLAKALGIPLETTCLSVRAASRRVDRHSKGWLVRNRQGVPITKPFRNRAQAERFADQTGEFVEVEVPVLWFKDMALIRSIPLYGVEAAEMWLGPYADIKQRKMPNRPKSFQLPNELKEPSRAC